MRRHTKAKDMQQVLTSLHIAQCNSPQTIANTAHPMHYFHGEENLPIFSAVAVFTPAHWLIIRNRDIFWRGRFCFWRRKFVANTYTLSGLCDSPHLHLQQGQIEVCNSAYFLCGRETLVVAMRGCCCIHLDNAWCYNAISIMNSWAAFLLQLHSNRQHVRTLCDGKLVQNPKTWFSIFHDHLNQGIITLKPFCMKWEIAIITLQSSANGHSYLAIIKLHRYPLDRGPN